MGFLTGIEKFTKQKTQYTLTCDKSYQDLRIQGLVCLIIYRA